MIRDYLEVYISLMIPCMIIGGIAWILDRILNNK